MSLNQEQKTQLIQLGEKWMSEDGRNELEDLIASFSHPSTMSATGVKLVEELMKKSEWKDWTHDDNWLHIDAHKRGYFVPTDLCHLTELVVQECCNIVNLRHQTNNPNDCVTVLDIKERFGIE